MYESAERVQIVARDAGDALVRVIAEVGRLAAELPLDELPELFAGLERSRWIAQLRVGSRAALPSPQRRRLLTVAEVAELLRISETNVYQRAKTDLRSAALNVGPGQLRFDADRVDRFLAARFRQ